MVRSNYDSWFYIRLGFGLDLGLCLKFERTNFPECRLRHVDVGTAVGLLYSTVVGTFNASRMIGDLNLFHRGRQTEYEPRGLG